MKKNTPYVKVGNSKYYMGALKLPKEEYSRLRKSDLGRTIAPNLIRTNVDLSHSLPIPRSQGAQGSCTAWATAYAYKSYQEKVEHHWGLNTFDHIFSPAYIYNQINGGEDKGSYVKDAMNLMVNQGCAPWSVMPYDPNDYTTQPNSYQRKEASKYESKSWKTIFYGDIETIKAHLSLNDPLVIAIPVFDDFCTLNEDNPIYNKTEGKLLGWHSICLIGYNDGIGAFKFINSWGSSWGLDGYGWISYDIISNPENQIEAYTMEDIIQST